MAPASFMPSGRNEVIVRIFSYQDGCPKGTMSGARLEATAAFSSLSQLLMAMEEQMDQVNYPQRGEEPRAFRPSGTAVLAGARPEGEPIATFRIRVLFRQNASWQGTLLWTDQSMDAQFRSVLELIRLLDSALTSNLE